MHAITRTHTNTHDIMTTDEAAAELRVSPNTVRLWLISGRLAGVKLGHRWRVRRADVLAILGGDNS